MKTMLATAALIAGNCLVGCAQHSQDMRTTAPNVTPSYEGSHYNPSVNSDGALTDRNDPAIRPSAASPSGTSIGGTGTGSTGGSSVGGGTSSENAGSSAPTGTPR